MTQSVRLRLTIFSTVEMFHFDFKLLFAKHHHFLSTSLTMFPSLHNPFSKRVKTAEEIVLKKNIECLILIGDNIFDNFCGLEDPTKDIEYQIADTLHRTLHSKDKGKSARKESADNESKQDDNHLHPNDNQSDLIHIHNLSLHGLDVDGLLNGMCPDPQHIALRQKCGLSPYRVTKIEKNHNDNNSNHNDNDSDHENEEKEEERLYPLELLSSMVTDSEIKVSSKSKDKHHINPTAVLSIGFIDLLRNLKYGKPELIIEALRKESFPENIEKAVVRIVDELALNLIIVWSTYFVFDYIPSLFL